MAAKKGPMIDGIDALTISKTLRSNPLLRDLKRAG